MHPHSLRHAIRLISSSFVLCLMMGAVASSSAADDSPSWQNGNEPQNEDIADDETPAGEVPPSRGLDDHLLGDQDLQSGELSDPDLPDQDLPSGELPDQDLSDQDLPSGELSDQDLSDQDLPSGDLPEGGNL